MSDTGQSKDINWNVSHILLDNGKTEELLLPIKATDRIKYTCLALSNRYIAFGASSGGLYIFQKDTHKYLQVIVNKEGSVSHVTFSPDENLVGLSTTNGFVVIWQLNVANRKKPELLMTSFAHKGSCLTCLQWNDTSQRLYSGDSKGKVTVTNAFSRKVSGLLQLPTAPIISLDSAIVQLDFIKDYLLVSSFNKCHICNIKRQQFYSVGKKLRDGLYGACFHLKSKEAEDVIIYSARPGSRLWESNLKGEVVATHQFKGQLAIPDLPIVSVQDDERYVAVMDNQPQALNQLPQALNQLPQALNQLPQALNQLPQALNFPCLLKIDKFVMSWNEKAIYILDISKGKVVLWSRPPSGIKNLSVYKSDIYFIDNQSRIYKLSFLTIERCIVRLFIKKSWKLCASICYQFSDNLTNSTKSRRLVSGNFLKDVKEHLLKLEKTEDLISSLDDVIYKMEQVITEDPNSSLSSRRSSVESVDSIRLESGIYLIKSRRGSEESLESLLSSEVSLPNGSPSKTNDILKHEEEHSSVDNSTSKHIESVTNSISTLKELNPNETDVDMNPKQQVNNVDLSVSHSNCQSNDIDCDVIIQKESLRKQIKGVDTAAEANKLELTDKEVDKENEGSIQCKRTKCEGSRSDVEIAVECEETVASPSNKGDCVDAMTTKDTWHNEAVASPSNKGDCVDAMTTKDTWHNEAVVSGNEEDCVDTISKDFIPNETVVSPINEVECINVMTTKEVMHEEAVLSSSNEIECVNTITKDIRQDDIGFRSPELAKNHNTMIETTDEKVCTDIAILEQDKQPATTMITDKQACDGVLRRNPLVIFTPSLIEGSGEPEVVVEFNQLEESDSFAEGAFQPVIRRTESFSHSSNNDNRTLVRRSYSMSSCMNTESSSPKPARKQRQRNGKKKKVPTATLR